jgi:hypothetical protein
VVSEIKKEEEEVFNYNLYRKNDSKSLLKAITKWKKFK